MKFILVKIVHKVNNIYATNLNFDLLPNEQTSTERVGFVINN